MRLPCCGVPLPSKLRTTSSPMSTALNRARLAKISSEMVELGGGAVGGRVALAATGVPSSSSALDLGWRQRDGGAVALSA